MSGEVIKNYLDGENGEKGLDNNKDQISDQDKKALQDLLDHKGTEVNTLMIDAINDEHPGLLGFLKQNQENVLNTVRDFLKTNPKMSPADTMGLGYLVAVTKEGDYQKVNKDSLGGKNRGEYGYLQNQQTYLNKVLKELTGGEVAVTEPVVPSEQKKSEFETNTIKTTGADPDPVFSSFLTAASDGETPVVVEKKETITNSIEDIKDLDVLEKIKITTNMDGNHLLEQIFDELPNTDKKPLSQNLKRAIAELKNFKGDVKSAVLQKTIDEMKVKDPTMKALSDLATAISYNESQIKLEVSQDATKNQSNDAAVLEKSGGNLSKSEKQILLDVLQTEYGTTDLKALGEIIKDKNMGEEAKNLIKSYQALDAIKGTENDQAVSLIQQSLEGLRNGINGINASLIENAANTQNALKNPTDQAKEALGDNPDVNKYNTAIDGAIDSGNGPLVKELFNQRAEFVKGTAGNNPDLVAKGAADLAKGKAFEKEKDAIPSLVEAANNGNDEAALMLVNTPKLLRKLDKQDNGISYDVHTRIMVQAALTGDADAIALLKSRRVIDLDVDARESALAGFAGDGKGDQNNADKSGNGKEKGKEKMNGEQKVIIFDTETYETELKDNIGDRDADRIRDRREAVMKSLEDKISDDEDVDITKSDIRLLDRKIGRDKIGLIINTLSQTVDADGNVSYDIAKVKNFEKNQLSQNRDQSLEGYRQSLKTSIQLRVDEAEKKADEASNRKEKRAAKRELRAEKRALSQAMNALDGLSNKEARKMSSLFAKISESDMRNLREIGMTTNNVIAAGNAVEQNKLLDAKLEGLDSKDRLTYVINSLADFDGDGKLETDYIGSALSEAQMKQMLLHAYPRPNYEEILNKNTGKKELRLIPGEKTNRLLAKVLSVAGQKATDPEFKKEMQRIAGEIKGSSPDDGVTLFANALKQNQLLRDIYKTSSEMSAEFIKDKKVGSAEDATDTVDMTETLNKKEYQPSFSLAEAQKLADGMTIDREALPPGLDQAKLKKNLVYDIFKVANVAVDTLHFKVGQNPDQKSALEAVFGDGNVGVAGSMKIPLDANGAPVTRNNPIVKNKFGEVVKKLLVVNPAISRAPDGSIVLGLAPGFQKTSADNANRFSMMFGAGVNLSTGSFTFGPYAEYAFQNNGAQKFDHATFNNAAIKRSLVGVGVGIHGDTPLDTIASLVNIVQVSVGKEKDYIGGIDQKAREMGKQFDQALTGIDKALGDESVDMTSQDSLRSSLVNTLRQTLGEGHPALNSLMPLVQTVSEKLQEDGFFSTAEGIPKENKIQYLKAALVGGAAAIVNFKKDNANKDLSGEVHITSAKIKTGVSDLIALIGGPAVLGAKKVIEAAISIRISAFKAQYVSDEAQGQYEQGRIATGENTRNYEKIQSLQQHAENIKDSLMIAGLEVVADPVSNTIVLSGEGLSNINLYMKKDTGIENKYAFKDGKLVLGNIGTYWTHTDLSADGKSSTLVLGGNGTENTVPLAETSTDIPGEKLPNREGQYKPLDQAKFKTLIESIGDTNLNALVSKLKIDASGMISIDSSATSAESTMLEPLLGKVLEVGSSITATKKTDGTYKIEFTAPVAGSTGQDKVKVEYIDLASTTTPTEVNIEAKDMEFSAEFAETEALISQISPQALYSATVGAGASNYAAFLNTDSIASIKPLLNGIAGADSLDAQKLATRIDGITDPKEQEYLVARFKQLSSMSQVTADKVDVDPTLATGLINALPASLDSHKAALNALVTNQTDYGVKFAEIDRGTIIKDGGAEGKKLLYAMRPISETMQMRHISAGYNNLKQKYENRYNKGSFEAILGSENNPAVKTSIMEARSAYMNASNIMNKSTWTRTKAENLVGVTAFYRGSKKEFGMTMPGETTTVDAHTVPITDPAVKNRFLNNHLDKNPNIKAMYEDGLMKTINKKLEAAGISEDLTTEQIQSLMKGDPVDLMTSQGKVTVSDMDLGMVFYAMGECANESIGMQLNTFKIAKPGSKPVEIEPEKFAGVELQGGEQKTIRERDIEMKQKDMNLVGVVSKNREVAPPPTAPGKDTFDPGHGSDGTPSNDPGKDTFNPGQGSNGNAPNQPVNTPTNTPSSNGGNTTNVPANGTKQESLGGT